MDDIESINSTIDRMRTFTPSDPYILTVPQDSDKRWNYHYAYQQRQWRENTPFYENEHESLQYMTYVYHEPGRSIYGLRESRPITVNGDKHGSKREGDAKLGEKAGTGANTPKKKISLDAYKKKQTGATPVSTPPRTSDQPVRKPAPKVPVKGPVERIKEDEELLAGMDPEPPAVTPPPTVTVNAKRKREDSVGEEDQVQKRQKQTNSHGLAPDKARAATPEAKIGPATPPQSQEHKRQEKSPIKMSSPPANEAKSHKELPPKLSPPPPAPTNDAKDTSLPPKLSPIRSLPPLPPRLSPTLPANIAETLRAREHYQSASRSLDVSTTGHNLTPPRQEGKNGLLKKSPRNGFRANSSSPAVRSDVEERGRPVSSVPSKTKAVTPSDESQDDIVVAKAKKAAVEKPPSLVIKLRFKKGIRETVKRILKMRPNPNRKPELKDKSEAMRHPPSAADARHREQREAGAKGVAQRVGPVKAANNVEHTKEVKKPTLEKEENKKLAAAKDNKRVRSDDNESDERPAKRLRAPVESPEFKGERQSSTPNKPDMHSPSASQRTMATPSNMRKELLSTSTKREKSTDSNYNTPSTQDQSSPPDTQSQPNGTTKHPPSSQPSTKTPRQAAWEVEQRRLADLGRELKHAASAHLQSLAAPAPTTNGTSGKPATPPTPTTEQKLAAVKALESLLAFLLAFTCADKAALASDPKQPPLTSTWRSMQTYHSFVKKHCESCPALLGLACWLAVIFNARILELANAGAGLSREVLVETQAMMLRAAHDAEGKLGFDTLRETFPGTFDSRAKSSGLDGKVVEERLEPGKGFKGPYSLPLGVQTSPLKAARAGWEMLREWVGQEEGVEYELKLRL